MKPSQTIKSMCADKCLQFVFASNSVTIMLLIMRNGDTTLLFLRNIIVIIIKSCLYMLVVCAQCDDLKMKGPFLSAELSCKRCYNHLQIFNVNLS